MRNFLINKKTFLFISALLLSAFFIPRTAVAGTRSSYYRKYFKNLGFDLVSSIPFSAEEHSDFLGTLDSPDFEDLIDDPDSANFFNEVEDFRDSVDTTDTEESPLFPLDDVLDDDTEESLDFTLLSQYFFFDQIFTTDPDEWQLVFASDEIKDLTFTNTIFICDSPYVHLNYYCLPDRVVSREFNVISVAEFPHNKEISVAHGYLNGNRILIIPEQNLYVPGYREVLSEYLEVYVSSLEFDHSYTVEEDTPSFIMFLKTWGFEIFAYAVSFSIFILIFGKCLKKLVHSPEIFLKKDTYTKPLNDFISIFRKYRIFLLLVLTVGFAALIPLVIFVTGKFTGGYGRSNMIIFINAIFDPSTVVSALKYSHRSVLAFYAYLGGLAGLTVLYLLPDFFDLADTSIDRLFSSKKFPKDSKFYKGLLLFLVYLGVFLSLIGDLSSIFPFLIIILALILYFSYFFARENFTFTLKERLISFGVFVLIVVLGLGINYYQSIRDPHERYQDLIGVRDKIVMLPYRKTHSEEVFFNPLLLEDFNYPLFIDKWLVYHPNFPRIKNHSLDGSTDFKDNFIIMGMGRNDYARFASIYPGFREEVFQEENSEFFYISDFDYSRENSYTLDLTVSCDRDPDPGLIRMEINYVTDISGDYISRGLNLLEFPGCASKESVRFIIPLYFDFIPSDEVLFELKDLPYKGDEIEDLVFYSNADPLALRFLGYAPKREILKGSFSEGDTLNVWTAYLKDAKEGRVIDRDPLESFDLGTTATELKRSGLVGDPFIIWSTNDGVLIRNEYANIP